jgi:hypothetical protein
VQPEIKVPKGVCQSAIDKNTVLTDYSPALFEDADGASCAVCLVEFDSGDHLRQLPCNHFFHRHCVDKWLARNKRCPLCMGDIEETRPCSPCAKNRAKFKTM